MTGWSVSRKKPYTEIGISRKRCIRCGEEAFSQWQVCADGGNFRPLCKQCDIDLNGLVLDWMKHPEADKAMRKYEEHL